MKKPVLQQKPPYPIESVDNALRLLQLLRDGGGIRLTAAAQELQIAPSTAHRLMAMLIYRGFAMQDDSRRYVAGPALGTQAIGAPWLHDVRHKAQEPMEILSSPLDETVNLVIRVGVNIRFLSTWVQGFVATPLEMGEVAMRGRNQPPTKPTKFAVEFWDQIRAGRDIEEAARAL